MFKNKVILDTNFLLIPGQFNVNIFTEIERIMDVPYNLCIIDKTLEELNKIMKTGKTRDSSAAKLGLAILGSFTKQKSLKTLASFPEKSVDDAIVRKANKKVYIATQDRELRKRAKKNGAHIISLKQKKYLSME